MVQAAVWCNITSLTIYDTQEQKDAIGSFVASSEVVKDLLNWQKWKHSKLVLLHKVLY